MKYNYKIVEENENPLLSLIEKDNVTVKFTVQDSLNQAMQVRKTLKEIKAQLELDKASADNIARNHPYTAEADEKEIEKAHHIVLYTKHKKEVESLTEHIKKIEDALEEHEKEMQEIEKQTGVKKEVVIDDLVEDDKK